MEIPKRYRKFAKFLEKSKENYFIQYHKKLGGLAVGGKLSKNYNGPPIDCVYQTQLMLEADLKITAKNGLIYRYCDGPYISSILYSVIQCTPY